MNPPHKNNQGNDNGQAQHSLVEVLAALRLPVVAGSCDNPGKFPQIG